MYSTKLKLNHILYAVVVCVITAITNYFAIQTRTLVCNIVTWTNIWESWTYQYVNIILYFSQKI